MKKYEWTRFDRILYWFLNYIVVFGWLVPIWSPSYKIQLFLTWLGCLILGALMAHIKTKIEKEKEPKKK